MTNRDAINLLEEVKMLDDTMYAYNPNCLEALDMAITALEAEETWYATHEYPPKTRWIPCSERLPEKPNMYTVTDSKGDVVRFIFYDNESSREYWMRCAKAWMPLPEPYNGGKA